MKNINLKNEIYVLILEGYILLPYWGGVYNHHMSRKQVFRKCDNKDADQLHVQGYRTADQRLCFCNIDSTISLLYKSEISSL